MNVNLISDIIIIIMIISIVIIVLSDNDLSQSNLVRRIAGIKVGFHYPSSRAEFTGRVDGPRTRVHFLTPVNSGRELG